MEIERLPFGQSQADKCRAGYLKWVNAPPGIPPDIAMELMARLKAGSTIRKLTGGGKLGPAIVTFDRFKKHCDLHPEWAVEAWRISKLSTRACKIAAFRAQTHCKYGHSLADARLYQKDGYVARHCRACGIIRAKRGGTIKPGSAEKVRALLKRDASISSFTSKRAGTYLMSHIVFTRLRREDTEIDALAARVIAGCRQRSADLRRIRTSNQTKRDQNNDYYKIRAMLPAAFPDKDDVVSAIFEDLLTGRLKRENVKERVRAYIAAHNRMFPTKFAKFGNAHLVSLDEVLFDGGTATRGDTVSRGLWD
jgi:hypothetical protein